MVVKVLFFANLRQFIGRASIKMEINEITRVIDLRIALAEQFPFQEALIQRALVAVNQQYSAEDTILPANCEIAFFPPVSGGCEFPTICRVTYRPINIDSLVKKITLNSTGAVAVFTGVIRGITKRGDAHETAALTYESYRPMAIMKMHQIAAEIRERWIAVEGVVLVQRIGTMQPKTVTVVIACSSSHRDEGVFEAARYGIDRLKEIVPVWKKEISPEGEVWIEGDYLPKAGE